MCGGDADTILFLPVNARKRGRVGRERGVRYLLIIISRTLSHIIIIIGEKYVLKSLFLNENMAEKECWNKYDHLTLKSNVIHGDPILCRMEILRENTVEISFFEIHF